MTMATSNSSTAPKGAAGTCRKRRRRQGARRPEWVRPYRSAQRALDSAIRLIEAGMATAAVSEQSLERRPVRTVRRLNGGARGLAAAGLRLVRASQELASARESLDRAPELGAGNAPELVELASARWQATTTYLQYVTGKVVMRQVEVLAGLVCGELKPEHPSDSRPRIVLAPRPAPAVRAFLAVRRPRVADRISVILQRRRRTPRPAALTPPPRTAQGRAPPLSSTLAL
jgi:hypothetical protein